METIAPILREMFPGIKGQKGHYEVDHLSVQLQFSDVGELEVAVGALVHLAVDLLRRLLRHVVAGFARQSERSRTAKRESKVIEDKCWFRERKRKTRTFRSQPRPIQSLLQSQIFLGSPISRSTKNLEPNRK